MKPSEASGMVVNPSDTPGTNVNPPDASGTIAIDVWWYWKDPNRQNVKIGRIKTI